ncbi:hypothetical protein N658DRAFT_502430 [Parathielavia hyrcaniae]|uniref:Alpha N-terminal protein methyltransferase 1 n=1 Tax=Parathielavia hyrcaniae TaxID=113614 RepID=A0AAN6PQ56_9PEZI|nr:hypothetical protein N658DRAFT_502430 [Parathielavia hyrcaniae]
MSNPNLGGSPDTLIRKDDGRNYWNGVNADVDAMLGGIPSLEGFSCVSRVDLQGSRSFLAKLGIGRRNGQRKVVNALEGGAGIGRVTEGLLLDVADHVDVIEPVTKFAVALQAKAGVRNIFTLGLEEWQPDDGARYDLIWTQWCVGYLTDKELVRYLQRCREALDPSAGVIVIKENTSTSGCDLFDGTDSSVTREDDKFRHLFQQAGLRVVRTDTQKGFPSSLPRKLFPVRMYALKAKT